ASPAPRRARPGSASRNRPTSPRARARSRRSATRNLQAAGVGSRVAAPPVGAALAGIVVLAAALRFSTLGVQSYWLDEAYTAQIANLPVADVWHQVSASEGTPPLYYYLANGWRHFFGTSEFALRSLSALLGTATIPAAFYAGRELVSERAGLVTAL